jgi:monoamine oxidase
MLYFAGEATNIQNPANVTGAMDTGLRAASEIDANHDPQ